MSARSLFGTILQQANYIVYSLPSQGSDYTRRMGVTKLQGQFRMENKRFSFSRDCNTYGTN